MIKLLKTSRLEVWQIEESDKWGWKDKEYGFQLIMYIPCTKYKWYCVDNRGATLSKCLQVSKLERLREGFMKNVDK